MPNVPAQPGAGDSEYFAAFPLMPTSSFKNTSNVSFFHVLQAKFIIQRMSLLHRGYRYSANGCGGRSLMMMSPGHRTTVFSSTFSSSRILPGQW